MPIYVLSIIDFLLQWQSCIVVMETVWSTKLKLSATWPCTEKLCGPLPQNTGSDEVEYLA